MSQKNECLHALGTGIIIMKIINKLDMLQTTNTSTARTKHRLFTAMWHISSTQTENTFHQCSWSKFMIQKKTRTPPLVVFFYWDSLSFSDSLNVSHAFSMRTWISACEMISRWGMRCWKRMILATFATPRAFCAACRPNRIGAIFIFWAKIEPGSIGIEKKQTA